VALSGTKNVITGYLPAGIPTGGIVKFMDTSVNNPWQFAPTGWNWVFGPSASPTGSTGRNPTVVYNNPGIYTVTMTASNASGSSVKTKTNFVIVT
jgi:PKD repeat protein